MKKSNKIIDVLKSNWLANTGKTAVLIAVVIIIFLLINIGILALDPKDIDLMPDNLNSLTDESKEKIAGLPEEEKFEIYMFNYTEQDSTYEFATQYPRINKNITVEIIDSEERPDLVSKYNIEKNFKTVVIASGDKDKTYMEAEPYYTDFKSYDSMGQEIDLKEQRFTNAIISLSSQGVNTPVYMLTGHGEFDPTNKMISYKTYLELDNYVVKELNILSEQKVPDDCAALVIASPTKDIDETEKNAIVSYIKKRRQYTLACRPIFSSN